MVFSIDEKHILLIHYISWIGNRKIFETGIGRLSRGRTLKALGVCIGDGGLHKENMKFTTQSLYIEHPVEGQWTCRTRV